MDINAAIRCVTAGALALAMWPAAHAASAPAPGDAFVYRLVNGYSRESRAQIRHEVDRVDAASVTLMVTPDNVEGGLARTEVVTRDGNGLRSVLDSHGQKVEYVFASAAYPAYAFPLDAGKSWSVRVNATVPATGKRRSVRVDGWVLGAERIRVPAGEFDTIKIQRFIYPGDANFHFSETHVFETEWYAPRLGRAVRTERKSEFQNLATCHEDISCVFEGDWDVLELVQVPARRG